MTTEYFKDNWAANDNTEPPPVFDLTQWTIEQLCGRGIIR